MSLKIKSMTVPGMTENEKITGFGIKDNPEDPSPIVVWKGSAVLSYAGTIPTGVTITGLGEYDSDTNYSVNFIADTNYVFTNKTATTSGNPGTWTQSTEQIIENATYYRSLNYAGIADEDISFAVILAHFRELTIAKGAGVKECFFSNSADGSNPFTGSLASNVYTATAFNGTYYAFIKLDVGYNAKSDWVLISGTADAEDAIYRVASNNDTSDYNFGAISADKKVFTITWEYLSAYPSTTTTTTTTYYYGDTPGTSTPITGTVPSPAIVTSGNERKVFTNWDSLAVVTSARTIEAEYKQQYYATISGTRCSANLTTNWYDSGTVITWTTSTNCAFNSTGSQTTDTATINSGTTYSKSANYVNVTSYSGSNCSTTATTGWKSYGATITWTASSNYAFDSNGTATTTTATIPGVNSCGATHGKYTVTAGSYATANVSTGWYSITSSKTTTFTADSNHSFNGSSTGDTTTRSAAVPGSVDCGNPGYTWCSIGGTRCSANKSTGLLANGTPITWTRSTSPCTYGFSAGTSTTTTVTEDVAINKYSYSKSADYINISITSTRCTCDTAAGYRHIGDTITWTANTGTNVKYSFTQTSASEADVTKTATISATTSSYSANAQYNYFYVNIAPSTGFTCSLSSGWQYLRENYSNIKFTVPTATTNRKISFSNGDESVPNGYQTCTAAGQTISEPTNYVWMNCTFSGTNCSCNLANGWKVCGSQITWTADSNAGTGTYYSFANTGYTATKNGGTVTDGTTAYSASADHIYYQITVTAQSNSSCTAVGTGKYLKNSPNTSTFTVSNSNTYTFNSDHTGKNTATVPWTADSSKEVTGPAVYGRTYAVSIAASTGVSSVYLSTSSTATSGSASGARYNYNATVYAFAVLAEGYDAPSSWARVSGTANTTGAKYRVDSTATTQDRNFGSISANVKTFTISVDSHSFGTVYLNDNEKTGSSFTASYWDTLKVSLPARVHTSNSNFDNFDDPILEAHPETKNYSKIDIKAASSNARAVTLTGNGLNRSLAPGDYYVHKNLSYNTEYTYYFTASQNYRQNYTYYTTTFGGLTYSNNNSSANSYSITVKGAITVSWGTATTYNSASTTFNGANSVTTGILPTLSRSEVNMTYSVSTGRLKVTNLNRRVTGSGVSVYVYAYHDGQYTAVTNSGTKLSYNGSVYLTCTRNKITYSSYYSYLYIWPTATTSIDFNGYSRNNAPYVYEVKRGNWS